MVTNVGYIPPCLRDSTEYGGYHLFGHQAFMQLAELRHRGAFSTVSHTFAACCLMCSRSSNLGFQEYPKTWYKVTYIVLEFLPLKLTGSSSRWKLSKSTPRHLQEDPRVYQPLSLVYSPRV